MKQVKPINKTTIARPSIKLFKIISGSILLLMFNFTQAASLEIIISPSLNLPALIYIDAINHNVNTSFNNNKKTAKITSYLLKFKPQTQILTVGTKITVSNKDTVFHNTHIFNQGRTLFNVATPTIGVTVQRKLTRPGLFNVRCDLHPSMNAWIAIVNNNNYAFIEKEGIYHINDIKPGDYKLHIHRSNEQEKIIPIVFSSKEQKTLRLTHR